MWVVREGDGVAVPVHIAAMPTHDPDETAAAARRPRSRRPGSTVARAASVPAREGAAPTANPDEEAPGADGQPLSAFAYCRMRRLILSNAWAPGFQATEQEAANYLGMSRTPVREAMQRLHQEGLVAVVPRHGLRVLPISPEDMREIYEILTSLEATAAGLAAKRGLDPAAYDALDAATGRMEAALAADDLNAWAEADERFHATLLDLCGNPKLKAVVVNFWDRAHRARMITLRLRPKPVASTREHAELVDAIRRRDPDAARELHRQHRERAGRELLGLLGQFGLHQL